MSAFLRKYATGTGADICIPIIKRAVVDFAVSADWTPAAGDVKISIDGGAAANIGTLPTAVTMGNTAYWKFVLSNAELTGKTMTVTVADSATKAVEDQAFIIETYGHASAMYQVDKAASEYPANVTKLLGTAWLTPGVAGTPDVNTKTIGATAVQAIWDALSAALTTANSIGKRIVDYLTGDIFARQGAPAGASHAADIAAIKVDTAAAAASSSTAASQATTAATQSTAGAASAATAATQSTTAAAQATTAATQATAGAASAATAATQATTAATQSTAANVAAAAVKVVTDKLATAIEPDGGVHRFTTNALELAPGGGGGSLSADQDAALTRIDRTVKGIASKRE